MTYRTIRKIFLVMSLAVMVPATGISAESPVGRAIEARIDQFWTTGELQIGNASIASRDMLPDLYERNRFEPLWQNPQNVSDLINDISTIASEGLSPEDYHFSELLAIKLLLEKSRPKNVGLQADYDILLTDSLIRLCYHLLWGKVDPDGMHPHWNMGRQVNPDKDPVGALERRLRTGTLAEGLKNIRPRYPRYHQLKNALAQYRTIQETGGWQPIPEGPTLKPGTIDERVVFLRRRLAATEDSVSKWSASTYYDETLVPAVKRFQRRHNLEPDGKVGKKTLAALNIPVGAKIDQLRVNLERARWVFHKLPPDYLWVDIAGFKIHHYIDEQAVWSSRIMVGKPYRHTPVFKSKIKYIVFNPTWTVPPTILKEDILPKLKQGPDYLYEKKIRVIARDGSIVDPASVDWSAYRTTVPFTLQQAPGPLNALGRVKFILPNRYFIFMHDTPSRHLFEKEDRAFSSGCIRVEKYAELAQMLLNDQIDWSPEKIQELIDAEQTRRVNLTRNMPVILVYCTVAVDENGKVIFKEDVYNRDPAVLKGLNEPFRIWQRKAFL
jgi:murein L,D-transpeptidase YcbB/YkuD